MKRRGRLDSFKDVDIPENAADYDGLAVNYRFHMDENKGWRVLISMEQPCLPKVTTDVSMGVIGVDLNYDHLAVCEIDHEGNHLKSWSVPVGAVATVTDFPKRVGEHFAVVQCVPSFRQRMEGRADMPMPRQRDRSISG